MFRRFIALMISSPTALAPLAVAAEPAPSFAAARQITFGDYHHVLTNANVWSPDGRRIVYDVRSPGQFDGDRIEEVEVLGGETRVLYRSRHGAHCGVATYSPAHARVVFILGPENPTPEWSYGFSRRRGVLLATDPLGEIRPLDAMNYAPPFAPGALRGGSHVHVFSPDGKWVSFTYDDELLTRLDASPSAAGHEPNQRNVGVAVPRGPVQVARNHPRNHDGDWFSVLVTRTVAAPVPGSDEISRACEEAWVGTNGYTRPDGTRQKRALAFQGDVVATDGSRHAEVFIVDLPADFTVAGEKPLAGTPTTRPAPPRGVAQRRLTHTTHRRHLGLASAPRHWLRSSPDGSAIAFLQKDEGGIVQLWTVSPHGGAPRQITGNTRDIASAFTWSPDGRFIAHGMDGSVCRTEVATGKTERLTAATTGLVPLPLACVFSPDGTEICFGAAPAGRTPAFSQIFVLRVGR